MRIMLFIKDGHRLIKVLSNLLPDDVIVFVLYTALALMVDDAILGDVQNLIPFLFYSEGKIQILPIHKKVFIEPFYLVQYIAWRQVKRTGGRINFMNFFHIQIH